MKYFFTLTLTLLFILSCSDIAEEKSLTEGDFPDQESWNSTIILTKNGVNRAVIQAGHLRKYDQTSTILMDESVAVDFFNARGKPSSHLTAQFAEVNEKTNHLTARQNVVVVSDSGATLYTEALHWNHQQERITSDTTITLITEKQDTLKGIGFESDADLEKWTILKPSGVTARKLDKS